MLRISLGNQERGLADVGWSSHKRCDPQSDTNTNIRNNPLPEREREILGDDKRYFIPISAKILTLKFNIIPGKPSMKN